MIVILMGEVVFHCGFDLHFPNSDVEHHFMCFRPFVYLLWRDVYSSLWPIFIFLNIYSF